MISPCTNKKWWIELFVSYFTVWDNLTLTKKEKWSNQMVCLLNHLMRQWSENKIISKECNLQKPYVPWTTEKKKKKNFRASREWRQPRKSEKHGATTGVESSSLTNWAKKKAQIWRGSYGDSSRAGNQCCAGQMDEDSYFKQRNEIKTLFHLSMKWFKTEMFEICLYLNS